MGIFGVAKRGFGLLKKSQKADRDQTIKKAKKLIKESKAAIQKRLMTPAPITPVGAGKKFVGRINPPGIPDVKIKKSAGGPALKLLSKLKKRSKLKGIHGGKAMIGLGAGAAAAGIAARNQIKKFERDVEKAGGLDAYYDKMKKKQGTGPAGGPKKSIKPKKKEKRGTKGL